MDREPRTAVWALVAAVVLGAAGLVSALAQSVEGEAAVFSADASSARDDVEAAASAGTAGRETVEAAAEVLAQPGRISPERVVRALAAAYPERVREITWRSGDWMLKVDDTWFAYADARLLPEALRERAADYSPQSFYQYPRGMPDFSAIDDAQERTMEKRLAVRATTSPERYPGFFDAVWRSSTYEESGTRTARTTFLGFRLTVHQDIVPALAAVERRIESLRAVDPSVEVFVSSLGGWAGWNWRVIYGTRSRSFHSYGVAIDMLLDGVSAGRQYWQWAQSDRPGWYRKAVAAMYRPPQAVIEAFEAYGFVWGGKWTLFDAMHFEYRPELLLLSGFKLERLPPADE